MLGSVLILGGDKKERLNRAWEVLAEHGFKSDSKGTPDADLLVVQREENKKSIGIAQARQCRDFLRERPFEKKVKAVLVEDAQALTDDAQGSLLKILEEPPAFGLIILLADKEGSLLSTVVSRCQKISVSRTRLDRKDRKHAGKTAEQDVKENEQLKDPCSKSPYNLSTYTYEQLFDIAKELSAKGKEEALDFLEQVLHEDIKNGASPPIIQKMERALKELKDANVALKFTLEHLFLMHVC